MMDLATIREMNREAGETAKASGSVPYVFSPLELRDLEQGNLRPLKRIPYLGDYVPSGWHEAESLFADSSGFGQANEPALTHNQLAKRIVTSPADSGWGLSDVGQFQLYVNRFETR